MGRGIDYDKRREKESTMRSNSDRAPLIHGNRPEQVAARKRIAREAGETQRRLRAEYLARRGPA